MCSPKRPRSICGFSIIGAVRLPVHQTRLSQFVPSPQCPWYKRPSLCCKTAAPSSRSIFSSRGDGELVPRQTAQAYAGLPEGGTQHSAPNITSQEAGLDESDSSALDVSVLDDPKNTPQKRVMSVETRQKIAFTMLGQTKSDDMRAKVSKKLKGRVPWNKGKKLSPETRARMSRAHVGRLAWNKGRRLSDQHRDAIGRACGNANRKVSTVTRRRMQMARRRPGDAIVGTYSEGRGRTDIGSYPLVDSADINAYVILRRELRVWSDEYVKRNSKRPSLAIVRKIAPAPIVKKFEKYAHMRDRIRGLASDVYGSVNPSRVPVVATGQVTNRPSNNNSQTVIRVTKHGNFRLARESKADGAGNVGYSIGGSKLEGSTDDMWDMYDRPQSPQETGSAGSHESLVGAHELQRKGDQLSANDYRMIGKYRLMETMDINRYMSLRRELQRWSAAFRQRHGRTPALSDARSSGRSTLYDRFCEYLGMRDRMSGLVQEVYGTGIDDVETFRKVNVEGKVILDTLRASQSEEYADET